MRLIIEARLIDGDNDAVEEGDGVPAVIERPGCCLAELGLTLAEARSLLAKVQAELISKQVQPWLSGQTHCRSCGAALNHKDSRSTVLRTVYGKVTVKSPWLWPVCLPADCANATACGVFPVRRPDLARHSGAGITPGEVGSSFAIAAGRGHAQGRPASIATQPATLIRLVANITRPLGKASAKAPTKAAGTTYRTKNSFRSGVIHCGACWAASNQS